MMKYKYTYNRSGVMTFYDSKGKPHTVTGENREVILDEKLDILGLKREEIGRASKKKIKESEV